MAVLLPKLAVPVVHACDLPALVAHYRDALQFTVLQEVRRVVAFVQQGPVRLQLWQRTGDGPRDCRIELEGDGACVFRVHARLARHARSAMVERGPELKRWGAWEFSMFDCQGNRLIFSQWMAAGKCERR